MAFTKITEAELKSRGCTTLPNQPTISAQELKEEFDAPAKEIVAPKVNNLIDELEAATAAASLGATAPTGFTGETVQALLDVIAQAVKTIQASQVGATPPPGSSDDDVQSLINNIYTTINNITVQLDDLNAKKHTHSNKALLDTYSQTESDLADAVSKKHSHSNKALLDTYEQTETDLADAVEKKHTHSNKSTLDKLSEDGQGRPTFDGNAIPTSGQTGGLQKFIDQDILTPTGSGTTGDLIFKGTEGDGNKELYRYENGEYVKINMGGTPVEANPAVEATTELVSLLVNETVYSIPNNIIDYSTTEQNTGIKYLDGSTIYQKSYNLSSAIALTADTWTNAVQTNLMEEVITVEGKTSSGDMIGLIGRVNNGYAQVMSLMSANQSLKILTLRYIKKAGAYDFDSNYSDNTQYTLYATVATDDFISDIIRIFCTKNKEAFPTQIIFDKFLNKTSEILTYCNNYKDDNAGVGVEIGIGFSGNNPYRIDLNVQFESSPKTVNVGAKHTENGYEYYGTTNPFICNYSSGGGKNLCKVYMTQADYIANYSHDEYGANIACFGIYCETYSNPTSYAVRGSNFGIHKA